MVDQTNKADESIFTDNAVVVEDVTKDKAVDPTVDTLLQSITADDGRQKYNSVPDALKALAASQEHIRTLESEKATADEKAASAKAVEDVLNELRQANANNVEPTNSPTVDAKQIEDIIDQRLQAKESSATAEANVNTVRTLMADKFGTEAEAKYIAAAKDAGIPITHLNNLAAISPQAVLKLVGLGEKDVVIASRSSSGSINTAAMKPTEKTESVKVGPGASSAQMVAAWRAARPAEA
jgi:flagellar biosynthesis GTPase FlhF